MFYVADLYSLLVREQNLFGSRRVFIQPSKFIVFYNGIEEAVERAIKECIEEDILREFLERNRAEAKAVSIYEYNEAEHMRMEREDYYSSGYEDGCRVGHEQGQNQGRVQMLQLIQKMTEDGLNDRISQLAADAELLGEMLRKYGLA